MMSKLCGMLLCSMHALRNCTATPGSQPTPIPCCPAALPPMDVALQQKHSLNHRPDVLPCSSDVKEFWNAALQHACPVELQISSCLHCRLLCWSIAARHVQSLHCRPVNSDNEWSGIKTIHITELSWTRLTGPMLICLWPIHSFHWIASAFPLAMPSANVDWSLIGLSFLTPGCTLNANLIKFMHNTSCPAGVCSRANLSIALTKIITVEPTVSTNSSHKLIHMNSVMASVCLCHALCLAVDYCFSSLSNECVLKSSLLWAALQQSSHCSAGEHLQLALQVHFSHLNRRNWTINWAMISASIGGTFQTKKSKHYATCNCKMIEAIACSFVVIICGWCNDKGTNVDVIM